MKTLFTIYRRHVHFIVTEKNETRLLGRFWQRHAVSSTRRPTVPDVLLNMLESAHYCYLKPRLYAAQTLVKRVRNARTRPCKQSVAVYGRL